MGNKAKKLAQVRIHPTAVVEPGAEIGAGTKIWHFVHIREKAQLGKNCILGQNVYVGCGVRIGDRVKIQNNVSVYEGVTLQEEVFCGPSAVFTNVIDPRAFIERKEEFQPTLVRRGATVGANATILCGCTLGQYCMIGAGAVVTTDVPDHALMVGVPARRQGWVCRCAATISSGVGARPQAPTRCSRCGALYEWKDGAPVLEWAGE